MNTCIPLFCIEHINLGTYKNHYHPQKQSINKNKNQCHPQKQSINLTLIIQHIIFQRKYTTFTTSPKHTKKQYSNSLITTKKAIQKIPYYNVLQHQKPNYNNVEICNYNLHINLQIQDSKIYIFTMFMLKIPHFDKVSIKLYLNFLSISHYFLEMFRVQVGCARNIFQKIQTVKKTIKIVITLVSDQYRCTLMQSYQQFPQDNT
eukprot:TRINITY_DN38428_c0_g3_i1.p1 TRINITY_DN38428_c0_g3~~TRINITY_DN38428_c0_g3_i1.p1  ORF type:complete len:204 (-),score=-13.78 TRINITY_DN38428_c0_g3_i1:236-847(-)